MFLSAVVWWFWIGLLLAIPSILMVVATVVGYLTKVVAPRYPREAE